MRLLYCCAYFLLSSYITVATEYAYPVASLDDTTILYIHQTSPQTIQLFTWNIITHRTEQVLWSLFNPAGIQLLPDNKGFSFIDNGRLRIKNFQKRSPKSIDFDIPIFNINELHWLNEHTAYCSAQQNNFFSIFQVYDDGRVDCLVSGNKNKDYMYPQKINDQLFYIQRKKINTNGDYTYSIWQKSYNEMKSTEILNFGDKSIIFLLIISETEGFVIEHKNDTDKAASFIYHHLIKEGGDWQRDDLFSFAIPMDLFLHKDHKLFESILPLLPRIIDNKIYFVDCSYNNNHILELYYYDLIIHQKNKISLGKNGHIFVPIQCGEKLYSGGTSETTTGNISPFFVF